MSSSSSTVNRGPSAAYCGCVFAMSVGIGNECCTVLQCSTVNIHHLAIYYWPAYTECRRTRLVTVAGVCRLSPSVVCNTRICNITHQGAARGGPVVLRLLRVTPCFH